MASKGPGDATREPVFPFRVSQCFFGLIQIETQRCAIRLEESYISTGSLVRVSTEQNELRRITTPVSQIREQVFAGGRNSVLDGGWCGSDKKTPLLVVTCSQSND